MNYTYLKMLLGMLAIAIGAISLALFLTKPQAHQEAKPPASCTYVVTVPNNKYCSVRLPLCTGTAPTTVPIDCTETAR